MVEFGEEGLSIESFRIPWLIWIQLLMFLLLILLFYCFSSDNLIISDTDNPSCSLTSSQKQPQPVLHLHHVPVGENQSGIGGTAVTNINSRARRAAKNGEGSRNGACGLDLEDRADDKSFISNNNQQLHPCNIVRLAKIAFLKCLGLDSSSSSSVDNIDSEHVNEG